MFRVIPLAYVIFCALFEGSKAITLPVKNLPRAWDDLPNISDAYSAADRRLIILDSRHTLREPDWEGPQMTHTLKVLAALIANPKNTVAIASGTFMNKLEENYPNVKGLILAAEVGSVIRQGGELVSSTEHALMPISDAAEDAKKIIEDLFGTSEGFQFSIGANTLRFKYPKQYSEREINRLVGTLAASLEEKYSYYGLQVLHSSASRRINFNPWTADKGLFVQHMWAKFEAEHPNEKLYGLTVGDTKPRDDKLHQAMAVVGQNAFIVTPYPTNEEIENALTTAQHRSNGVVETLDLLEHLAAL